MQRFPWPSRIVISPRETRVLLPFTQSSKKAGMLPHSFAADTVLEELVSETCVVPSLPILSGAFEKLGFEKLLLLEADPASWWFADGAVGAPRVSLCAASF